MVWLKIPLPHYTVLVHDAAAADQQGPAAQAAEAGGLQQLSGKGIQSSGSHLEPHGSAMSSQPSLARTMSRRESAPSPYRWGLGFRV